MNTNNIRVSICGRIRIRIFVIRILFEYRIIRSPLVQNCQHLETLRIKICQPIFMITSSTICGWKWSNEGRLTNMTELIHHWYPKVPNAEIVIKRKTSPFQICFHLFTKLLFPQELLFVEFVCFPSSHPAVHLGQLVPGDGNLSPIIHHFQKNYTHASTWQWKVATFLARVYLAHCCAIFLCNNMREVQ